MIAIKHVYAGGEKFYYNLSFDIDDFIGDGVWWLQVYDEWRRLIYDKPLANSMIEIDEETIPSIIRTEVLHHRGVLR
jgi:hypothetical protein